MLINTLLKYLPLRCAFCQLALSTDEKAQRKSWCSVCDQSLVRTSRCLRCGLPTIKDVISCGRCLRSPPPWQSLCCINAYQFPYDKLLHRFKYEGQFWLAKQMANLLSKEITQPAPLLVPVPMHWQRRLLRGYNQSHVLAMCLAKNLHRPINAQALVRNRATKQQQSLNRKERLLNLHNAFALKQALPKHVALVDDVVTTGATLTEICRLLQKNKVERIDVYCIARSFRKK